MTTFRIEIDAIIAVIAATPKEALEQANAFVREVGSNTETSTRLIITGAEMSPTVLTLTDEDDIESIDGELSRHEVDDLET